MLVGTTSVSSGGQVYDVERIVIHPDFSSSFPLLNDVAVLKLTSDIKFSTTVNVIALASSAPSEGSLATLTGWGYTSYPEQDSPDTLQTIDLNTISNDYCTASFGLMIPRTSICTFNDIRGEGACGGDRFETFLKGVELYLV